jgi:hypothetical protein
LRRELGQGAGAREDFVAAKDVDPHVRRCLSKMNENVRQIARETNTPLVDGEEALARESAGGITGFKLIYDHIHFTPLGSEYLASEIERVLAQEGIVPRSETPDWIRSRMRALAAAKRDSFSINEWIGWNDSKSFLSNRDLWKYDDMRRELDEEILHQRYSAKTLTWAANGYALAVGGEARARELYARARAMPDAPPEIDSNLKWLDTLR